jgi:hypothetical protein
MPDEVQERMTAKDKVRARRAQEAKTRTHRQFLLESVRTHILPVLLQQGFAVAPGHSSGPVDRKSVGVLPFGLLRRARPDGGLDLVEIQFMTYQRPAFRINVCPVPKEGLMTVAGPRATEELEAGGLHNHFEMYAYPRWWIFFSLFLWRLRTPRQSDYERLALRVAGYLPEVELALREGKLGPHMRKIVFLPET